MSFSSTSPWSTFHCEDPDFAVRSALDKVNFPVKRRSLVEHSEVFRDMFSLGGETARNEQIVDVHETSKVLIMLLHLLHLPPQKPEERSPKDASEDAQMSSKRPGRVYNPDTVIPLPILLQLLELVDKYAIAHTIADILHVHLLAHLPAHGLQIYGYAWRNNLRKLAAKASQYLMPIASYGLDEIKFVPSTEAYHKIVQLQDLRVKELRRLVLTEEIFPHGYGACPSHQKETKTLWEARRLQVAGEIETITDVAGEMNTLMDTLPRGCQACHKAYTAAIKMLAYKSRRALRRIDQLPADLK